MKKPLGRRRHNVITDLQEVGWGTDRINLAPRSDKINWRAPANTVINL